MMLFRRRVVVPVLLDNPPPPIPALRRAIGVQSTRYGFTLSVSRNGQTLLRRVLVAVAGAPEISAHFDYQERLSFLHPVLRLRSDHTLDMQEGDSFQYAYIGVSRRFVVKRVIKTERAGFVVSTTVYAA